jgi:hypothetical protein
VLDATANCYAVLVSAATRPVPHWERELHGTLSDASIRTWPLHVGGSFSDAASSRGTTSTSRPCSTTGSRSGCGGAQFCPTPSVTRAQMAVFPPARRARRGLRARRRRPARSSPTFPRTRSARTWIERLAPRASPRAADGRYVLPRRRP